MNIRFQVMMIQVCDVPLMSLIPDFHFPRHGVSYASRAWGQDQQYKYCNMVFHSYSYMQMVVDYLIISV